MSVLNIHSIIDVQTVVTPTPQTRRDFRNLLFVYKGNQVGGQRVNSYTSLSDVVTAYGSNTEPVKAASAFFSGGFNGIKPINFMVANSASGDTWSNVITELTADPRYYMMAVDNTFSVAEQKQLAAAIEAATKINYLGAFLDVEPNVRDQDLTTDTTTMAKYFYTNTYDSNFVVYDDSANQDNYKQVAVCSYFATVDYTAARPLGQAAFKQFSGQTPTTLTDTQFSNITTKNCNLYAAFGEVGRNITYKGVVPTGTFIDTIIGANWLNYNITYNIYDLLVQLPKLSYTNSDFNKLYSVIASALEQSKQFGLIAAGTDSLTGIDYPKGYEISIPSPASVSAADKANGVLNNIIVTAVLAGNIVKITLTSYLRY